MITENLEKFLEYHDKMKAELKQISDNIATMKKEYEISSNEIYLLKQLVIMKIEHYVAFEILLHFAPDEAINILKECYFSVNIDGCGRDHVDDLDVMLDDVICVLGKEKYEELLNCQEFLPVNKKNKRLKELIEFLNDAYSEPKGSAIDDRRKMCEVHFGKDDILIDGFRLNAVHIIPKPIPIDAEVDFYMDTGFDCYLLRVVNKSSDKIIICKHNPCDNDFIYIVVEKLIVNSIEEELKFIIHNLKKIKIPKKVYEEIEYTLPINFSMNLRNCTTIN